MARERSSPATGDGAASADDRAAFDAPPIPAFDDAAADAARARQRKLTKPPGSLGRLEDLAVALAGLTGDARPSLAEPAVLVAAADHGVVAEGVSAYPGGVTRAMLANFADGGAAVNALADVVGAETVIVDAGVDGDPVPGVGNEKVARGTRNLAEGPAMTRAQAVASLEAGVRVAETDLATADVVALGEMGIGNTTVASALTAALADADPAAVTGHGTGVDEETRAHKVAVVERGLAENGLRGESGSRDEHGRPTGTTTGTATDPVEVLRRVGGFEVGLLAGAALGCAADRTPVVVDGVVSGAAALVAAAVDDAVRPYLLPSHGGAEPGHAVQLEALGLDPLFEHDLRLGEGSGACLALATYRAACATHDGMATFAEAGIGPE